MSVAFADRIGPAPTHGALALDDLWVWGASVIRGEDGRYHMFASAWPRALSFAHWATNSMVVHAAADTPLGPFAYEGVALPERDAACWDARHTHNPTIHKFGDTYCLFYSGSTYDGDVPTPDNPTQWGSDQWKQAWNNSRIGLATSQSVYGPWQRRDAPILAPRPGRWDAVMTGNPAPCIHADGRTVLLYKSIALPYVGDRLPCRFQIGVAAALHPAGPYDRVCDDPILDELAPDHVEDMYLWWNGQAYEMIGKDMEGGVTGEVGAGVHARSADAVKWTISDPPLAYSCTVRWDDGGSTPSSKLERPQLLVEDGGPTHLYLASATGGGHYTGLQSSRSLVFPLNTD